jgi:hypothetical protein
MVTPSKRMASQRGLLNLELAIAITILAVVMLPLAYMFAHEGKLLRAYYRDAVAMQILDGEMEVIAAGEWRRFAEGRHDYPVAARAAMNLPPGRFVLTRTPERVRLDWLPQKGRAMHRDVKTP